MPNVQLSGVCRHCTVRIESGDSCDFCRTYVPPATIQQRLDDAINRIDLLRADINTVIRELPSDAPMFAIVDIVNALWNLRNASVLLDKANATLEAANRIDSKAVAR